MNADPLDGLTAAEVDCELSSLLLFAKVIEKCSTSFGVKETIYLETIRTTITLNDLDMHLNVF